MSMFFPELTSFMQPLSGEYAGRRWLFEKVPFVAGYGVEVGLLIDIAAGWGTDVNGAGRPGHAASSQPSHSTISDRRR